MNDKQIITKLIIVKEIIRIVFVSIFLLSGLIGALFGKNTNLYLTIIFFGCILIGIGKNPLDYIK